MLLAVWRSREGLTGQELAQKLGISKGYLSKIEAGRCYPEPLVTVRIAAATNREVTVVDLLQGWANTHAEQFRASHAAGRSACRAFAKRRRERNHNGKGKR